MKPTKATKRTASFGLLLLAVGCATGTVVAPSGDQKLSLRSAVERTLPLLQASMRTWTEESSCTSCHHQALGIMAVAFARERWFDIDSEMLHEQVDRTGHKSVSAYGENLQGEAGINSSFGQGYRMVALAAAGVPRCDTTDVEAAEKSGATALMHATFRNDLGLVRRLLDAGASVQVRFEEQGPLAIAAADGEATLVRLLVERGAAVDEPDAEGMPRSPGPPGSNTVTTRSSKRCSQPAPIRGTPTPRVAPHSRGPSSPATRRSWLRCARGWATVRSTPCPPSGQRPFMGRRLGDDRAAEPPMQRRTHDHERCHR